MSGAWKTCCVLLLCVSTLKVLATDDTSSQKDEEPQMTDEEINEELTKTMGTVLAEADIDKNGKISLNELTAWTQKALKAVHKRETKARMEKLDTNKDQKISWEEFQKNEEDIGAATEEQKKRRFHHADTDKDDLLSKNELNSMFHAQEKPHMHDVIYEEYMEIGDDDKDGRLSLEEYKTKMFKGGKQKENVADMFFNQQDKNQDGYLDREEIKLWMKSINTASKAKSQAKHFLDAADENKDGSLSVDEIKKNTEMFLSAAKSIRDAKQEAESKPKDGRCPFSHRPGKKAKETKETREAKEPEETMEAKEPEDEEESKVEDVKDEL